MGWWDAVKGGFRGMIPGGSGGGAGGIAGAAGGLFDPRNEGQYAGIDRGNYDLPGGTGIRQMGQQQAALAGQRDAPQAAYDPTFRNYQADLARRLQAQASGADSISRLQLQQGQDQLAAQQRSLVAGAAPQNSALAQRMASQQTGRGQQGLAFNQSLAGIQERNAAANALAGLSGQARGQDMQGSQFNVGAQLQQTGMNDAMINAGMGRDLAAAGMQQGGGIAYEGGRTTRAVGALAQPTQGEQILGAGTGLLGAYLASDERAKTDISDGGDEADKLMRGLRAKAYKYKDEAAHGRGSRLGIMAQDLERSSELGKSLVREVGGIKRVDVPAALGTGLGLIGRLNERIDKLEGRGGK